MKTPLKLPGKTTLLLSGAPLAGLLVAGGAFCLLDQTAAYHSPLAGQGRVQARWTPRVEAKAHLADWAQKKAEEQARLAELMAHLTTEKMVLLGKDIVHGKGLCFNCHQIGQEGHGTQGPNLQGVGARAGSRIAGMSDVDYLAQSLYAPDAFIVPGFTAAMIPVHQPPIGLSDLEVLMVVTYLQSLGGQPTVTPEAKLH